MRVTNSNISLENFNAWSGAVETKEAIINADKASDFENLIEELYPDGIEETQLNDLLWLDEDFIFESLGIETED